MLYATLMLFAIRIYFIRARATRPVAVARSMEDLVDYAHDIDRWSIWTNAIRNRPRTRLRATNYYRQDQDRGPQERERKKKAKTHLPSKGCARRARAQE